MKRDAKRTINWPNRVGSAPIGKGGLQFARTEAMGYARSEIARQVSVKVRSLVNSFSQQTGIGEEQSLDALTSTTPPLKIMGELGRKKRPEH
jgi:hypothetical protein